MLSTRSLSLLCMLGAAILVSAPVGFTAHAKADYPTRAVRILVGFPAGSGPDGSLRVLAEKLSEAWRQPVIVENVTGAGGNLACDRAAKAPPDGYTLVLCTNGSLAISPGLYARMPFDPVRDLAPIIMVSSADNILVVPPALPVNSVAQLIAYAKSKPGEIMYAHGGVGSTQHLAGALLKSVADVDIRPVAYRGASAVMPDLLSGRVQMFFGNIANVLPLVRSGELVALASTGLKRATAAPDIPTMDEQGFPGFNVVPWYGLMAPAATPRPIIENVYSETTRILSLPETADQFHKFGFDIINRSEGSFAEAIQMETKYWRSFLAREGIKATD